jgi:5-methylcytosine-specific restriction enzyme A
MSKWQAPGNGKGFDSFLGDYSKMNNRTIGALTYIREKSSKDGFIPEATFQKEIRTYLHQNFFEAPNASLETHFYKPALFYGLINRDQHHNLSLSIEGNLFINSYIANDFTICKKMIINQLDNATYPNEATPKVRELKLFPFRILFKLLLDNKALASEFITKRLIYISSIDSLELYEKTHNINDISSFDEYKKFNTWVVNSLVNLKILDLSKGLLSINNSVLEHIKLLYLNLDLKDMFFDSSACDINEITAEKRVQRDASLIVKAKQRDGFACVLDNNHKTFISRNNSYVEGHHIVPMFQQKNYDFKIDDVENIASLCPNCHREIHSADDKTQVLNKIYSLKKDYMASNNINLIDLYKMYSCV